MVASWIAAWPTLPLPPKHQDHVAFLDAAGILQPGPGGDERHADGTRLEQADRGRLLAQMLDRHHQPFGVGAVAADAELAARAPDLLADQVGRALDHGAGIVAAGRARPDGVRHGAQDGLDVGRVDPGAGHPDQGLAGLGTASRAPSRPRPRWSMSGAFAVTRIARMAGYSLVMGFRPRAAVAWRAGSSRARVSAAVATVPPRSSTSWRARSTSAALDGASLPRAR